MTSRTTGGNAGSTNAPVYASRSTSPEMRTRLQEIQSQEEYIIDTYTSVFDALNATYSALEEEYMCSEPDYFKDRIIRGVMAEVREHMSSNEAHLREARRELWLGYDEEMDRKLENGMKR